jgi:hypothetical protein
MSSVFPWVLALVNSRVVSYQVTLSPITNGKMIIIDDAKRG